MDILRLSNVNYFFSPNFTFQDISRRFKTPSCFGNFLIITRTMSKLNLLRNHVAAGLWNIMVFVNAFSYRTLLYLYVIRTDFPSVSLYSFFLEIPWDKLRDYYSLITNFRVPEAGFLMWKVIPIVRSQRMSLTFSEVGITNAAAMVQGLVRLLLCSQTTQCSLLQ